MVSGQFVKGVIGGFGLGNLLKAAQRKGAPSGCPPEPGNRGLLSVAVRLNRNMEEGLPCASEGDNRRSQRQLYCLGADAETAMRSWSSKSF